MPPELRARIAALPKVELHLHLEGAIRRQTFVELARRPNSSSFVDESLYRRSEFHFRDLTDFVTTVRSIMDRCLRSPDDYERIAYELFLDLAEQNVRYVELSFDPTRGIRLGIPFDEMLSAMGAARQKAIRERSMQIGLIIGVGRERGPAVVTDFVRQAAQARAVGVIGIDLHGDETVASPEEFVEAYEFAKGAGLGLRVHAGEGCGPESIWGAIRHLGASRIAHGVRAVEDLSLLNYLQDHLLTLDVCPTSNVKLGIVPSLSEHPIRHLYDAGVRVTVNSDDPFFFNTTITQEYQVLVEHLGFTLDDLKRVTLNAVDGAFLSESEQARLRADIERDSV